MGMLTDNELFEFSAGGNIAVESSNVASIRWDEETSTLYITFHSGGIYAYPNISWEMANSLARATSKGKWVHANLVLKDWPFDRLVVPERKNGTHLPLWGQKQRDVRRKRLGKPVDRDERGQW